MTHTVLAVVHSDLNSASHHSTNTEQYKADSSRVHAVTGARCASTGNRYACTETYLTWYVPYTADNNRQVAASGLSPRFPLWCCGSLYYSPLMAIAHTDSDEA